MCETRDLGIKWPQWHTLFEEASGGGHESGLPAGREKDASECVWERWAAKHVRVAGANPSYTKRGQTIIENALRKLVVEGCWVQS